MRDIGWSDAIRQYNKLKPLKLKRSARSFLFPGVIFLLAALVFFCGIKVVNAEDVAFDQMLVGLCFLAFGIVVFGVTLCLMLVRR